MCDKCIQLTSEDKVRLQSTLEDDAQYILKAHSTSLRCTKCNGDGTVLGTCNACSGVGTIGGQPCWAGCSNGRAYVSCTDCGGSGRV